MPVPRYYQAKTRLLDLLDDLPGHTPFPPERALSDLLRVSRSTIRKALDELVLEGRLLRGTGRQGTTVAPPGQPHRIALHALTADQLPRERTTTSTRNDVTTVESVLVHLDDPIGVRQTHLHALPGFATRYDPGTPLREFLATAYRLRQSEPRCTTALATPRVASLLNVRPATPLLAVSWLGHDTTGATRELSRVVLRSDRAHLTLPQVRGDQIV
ncbi:GntR family transcriptional regulator [Lentzea sp. NBRC 102530]|uniref:GntR family transcriptional regulator n=1 Tax=Lentzea sp. NBRC 102530 TaxID=3032201 RepID=UPI0024A50C1A|nr:GntR family transcriptional regulator [Lentzea sp. NBRC 102530]GLY46674.1 HTH-type transcriptional repressor DasR [Lentzea sp. NBRC 102530]